MSKWISVKDKLPKVGEICWVWCKEMGEVDGDWYEGERGEQMTGMFPDGERTYKKSGWYNNDAMPITHWMPMPEQDPPEPPKEEDDATE